MPQDEPPARRREGVELFNPHPESLGEIAAEYPFLQWRYEQFREAMEDNELDRPPPCAAGRLPRRRKGLRSQYRRAHRRTGSAACWRATPAISRFANRNLSAALFDLTVAARGIADDNYAWEVWETAGRYPHQTDETDITTVRISGEEVWLDTRKIRLRRRLPSTKRRMLPVGLKPRKKEKIPGEWASELNGASICSYPPEDLVIEDYGRFLKKKGKSILSEERARVEPFTTSILDGIDLRETIRNWHEAQNLRPAVSEDPRRGGLGNRDLR